MEEICKKLEWGLHLFIKHTSTKKGVELVLLDKQTKAPALQICCSYSSFKALPEFPESILRQLFWQSHSDGISAGRTDKGERAIISTRSKALKGFQGRNRLKHQTPIAEIDTTKPSTCSRNIGWLSQWENGCGKTNKLVFITTCRPI